MFAYDSTRVTFFKLREYFHINWVSAWVFVAEVHYSGVMFGADLKERWW